MIDANQLVVGVATGAGWRCDCFGDLRAPGSETVPKHLSWNHTYDYYPMAVATTGAGDVWRTAPVHFETCWVPMAWYQRAEDIDFIIEQGLKYHGTYFMPKSTALPEAWMDKLAAFCRKLGYRFVLRQSTTDRQAPAQGTFRFQCWIENVGVAPIYRRYPFALRLTQGQRSHIIHTNANILEWLPGDIYVHEQAPIPDFFEPGQIMLHAGLIEPATGQPRVRFAVEESDAEGWVPLDTIAVG